MVGVLDRKLWRDLKHNKGLLLAIISIIAVGVMCFVYMRSSYWNLQTAKQEYYRQCRMADFWIDLKKVPLGDLDELANLPGVVELRPRIQFQATVDLEGVLEPLNAQVLSLPEERRDVLNDIVLRRGGYFTASRDNEVLVNEAFAQANHLEPGDWIHLILNNRRQELFIVGTAISSEFVYTLAPGSVAPDSKRFGIFYLKRRFAEDVFDFDGAANNVVGLLAPDRKDRVDEVLSRAEILLDDQGVFATIPLRNQASNRFLSDEIRGLGVFAGIMPTLFLAVAAVVLNVLMKRLIDQQRVIVGTLKALGYSDLQVFLHYLRFAGLIGIIGGGIGCVAGFFMADMVTDLYSQFYEFPNLRNRFYPHLYLIGVAISLACSLVGTWQGARSALKLQPAEAMRPRPPRQGGTILLERIVWFWRKLSFGWRMTLRNVVRNRLRTAMGLFAALIGAAILCAGYMMSEALTFMIDFQYEKISRSDLDLSFKDEQSRAALLEARQLPGVHYAEPMLDVACEFRNGPFHRKANITGLVSEARLTIPRDLEGRRVPVTSAGLTMSRKLAEMLHLSVGDHVLMKPVKGLQREVRVPVVRVADSYIGISAYAEIEYLSRLIGEEYAVSGVQLQVLPGEQYRRALYREVKQLPAVQAINARQDSIDNLNKTVVETQGIFIGLLTLFAGVIFFGSILNASLISLSERQREVATLRTLGYTEWQVGGLFLRENLIVTSLGACAGLPLGYALVQLIAYSYDTEMFRFPVVWNHSIWIRTLVMACVFALAAHAIVQRSVTKMDFLEALKIKE